MIQNPRLNFSGTLNFKYIICFFLIEMKIITVLIILVAVALGFGITLVSGFY